MAGALPLRLTPMIIKLQRLKQETSLGLCISVAIIIKAIILFSAEFVTLMNFQADSLQTGFTRSALLSA